MAVVHFSDQDFKEKVIKSKIPVLVDFYAEWCGPCKLAAPVMDELAEEFRGKVSIGKLNIEENSQTAQKYEVMSIPTVILFNNGEEVTRKVGFAGKEGYKKILKEQLK